MRRRTVHNKGFTVVEALCAGIVLTLAAAAIGTAVRASLQGMRRAREFRQAAELLGRTLTKVDLIGPERLMLEGPSEGGFDPPHDRFRWEAEVDTREEGSLYEVTVRITWPTTTGQRQVEAQTLLNDAPNSRSPMLQWDNL